MRMNSIRSLNDSVDDWEEQKASGNMMSNESEEGEESIFQNESEKK